MSILGTVLIVILVLILLGGLGGPYVNAPWPQHYGVGYGGMGVLGILLIVLIVLLAMGRI